MATKRTNRDPFEVDLSPDQENELAQELSREVEDAMYARQSIVGSEQELDQWHKTYEGGDRKLTKSTPWPGAANLTSYLGTEKVDAMRARILQTVFVDPVWIVEGWGDAAARAPFVEEFHQWKVEEERLQSYIARAVHNSLIEGTGVLEVSERAEFRKVRARMQPALQMNPLTGQPMMDPMTGLPMFIRDEQNKLVEATTPEQPSAEVVADRVIRLRRGPQYRVISLRDYFVLPGHALDESEIWGHAKRFFRRMGQLKESERAGFYRNVEALGGDPERDPTASETRRGQAIAEQLGDRVEKELWEVPFLKDLDGDGMEEWYLATLSVSKRKLLRLQRDDIGMNRFLRFTPFPRPDSVYGYSFIGHKLGTIIDEHSAIRNGIADRSALVNSAPLKRMVGSLWDPWEQPWGPREVIDVRDKDEVTAFDIPDVPGSMVQRESVVIAASERLSGMNDATLGTSPQADRTLGEFETVMQQSFVRIDETIRHIQETMEDLWALRHEIWRRTLREGGSEDIPQSVKAALEQRNFAVPETGMTAEMLVGTFRGKPHGSVETADLNRQRSDFVGFLQALAQLVQAVPGLQMLLSQPNAATSILSQAMRVFRWEDRQGLVGTATAQPQLMLPAMQQPPVGPDVAPSPQLPALFNPQQ